jgi:hypothetical protein
MKFFLRAFATILIISLLSGCADKYPGASTALEAGANLLTAA